MAKYKLIKVGNKSIGIRKAEIIQRMATTMWENDINYLLKNTKDPLGKIPNFDLYTKHAELCFNCFMNCSIKSELKCNNCKNINKVSVEDCNVCNKARSMAYGTIESLTEEK